MAVTELRLRGILDSRAEITVEAELTLDGHATGRGSCPRAIAPGRRERPIGVAARLGPLERLAGQVRAVLHGAGAQAEVDERLAAELETFGVATALSVSIAFARARATAMGVPLWRHLADLAGTTPGLPRLLVNVFSGGIHVAGRPSGYQQVMVIPQTGEVAGDIDLACRVWAAAAELVRDRFGEPRLSASSGIVLPVSSAEQLLLLDEAIARSGVAGRARVGIDVAAEHLVDGDRYRLGGAALTATELAGVLRAEADQHAITYLEDPFDPADEAAWRALRADPPAGTRLVGDDLFATDADRVRPDLAHGVLLKPSQVGTVSGLIRAAVRAHRAGMSLAVSHRSGETDDTVICDLASALGADLIKVGGPRRGDRLAKYNQLLRLAEEVPTTPQAQVRKAA